MSKKIVIVVVLLIVVTAVLLGIALKSQNVPPLFQPPTPTQTISPLTKLIISPAVLDLNNASTGVLQVNIDSATNEITGVQLELQYDPKVLKNVTIEPGTFLPDPLILKNKVFSDKGRITLILGVTPQQNPVKGKGTVATIHFTTVPTQNTETEMTILPTSEVTAQGVNTTVLHEAIGAKISL